MSNLIILNFSKFPKLLWILVIASVLLLFIFCIYSIHYFSKKIKFGERLFLHNANYSCGKHCNIFLAFFAPQAIQSSRAIIAPIDGLRILAPRNIPADVLDERFLLQKADAIFSKELDPVLSQEVFH